MHYKITNNNYKQQTMRAKKTYMLTFQAMKIGDTVSYPIEKTTTIRSIASNFSTLSGFRLRTVCDKKKIKITVIRIA